MDKRDAMLVLRIPVAVKEALARAAAADERSMSQVAAVAIREWLASHGHLARPRRAQKRGAR